ncbi:MAG: cysteine--tRNA ligase [Candidatus Andersenbacteria bacterium]|nr:cysteine--tRNA ligase [bacterium]MDZ4225559.1 cysteine--tRNA ligase [Candidatus Andersenbacteria bacterium]
MHNIFFYNSLTREREKFKPRDAGKVRIYNCGPTVYKRQHLGNMRRFLFADFLRRSLEFFGYEVREITNITDVGHLTQDEIDAGEDKLSKEAKLEKVTPQILAEREIENFTADLAALNIQPAHKYPRATAHIKQMRDLIAALLGKKTAYITSSGVYFDVHAFPAYGRLSGNTVADLEAGKRVDVREEKKHPADFVLWIFDKKARQKWDSPWGVGYPGWHIECSAMSMEYLGTDIDIHTGGEDNKFPHHENEIAQSEGATGRTFARYWLHNSHLQMDGKKLAKREGEQLTLDTLREKGYDPLAFRLFVFGSHYRTKLNFTWEALGAAQEMLNAIKHTLQRLADAGALDDKKEKSQAKVMDDFGKALADDLNTPEALAVWRQYLTQVNKMIDEREPVEHLATAYHALVEMGKVVGVIKPLLKTLKQEVPDMVSALIVERNLARERRDFKESDRLRLEIEKMGYMVEDTPAGTKARRQ